MKTLVALLFALPAVLAAAQPGPDVKRRFQPFYDELNRRILVQRFDEAERWTAKHAHPQFAYIDAEQRAKSFAAHLRDFQSALGTASKVLKSRTRIDGTTMKGGTAILSTSGHWSMRIKASDGRPMVVDMTLKTKDTWMKSAGTWKLKEVRVTSENFTVDGKPWK